MRLARFVLVVLPALALGACWVPTGPPPPAPALDIEVTGTEPIGCNPVCDFGPVVSVTNVGTAPTSEPPTIEVEGSPYECPSILQPGQSCTIGPLYYSLNRIYLPLDQDVTATAGTASATETFTLAPLPAT